MGARMCLTCLTCLLNLETCIGGRNVARCVMQVQCTRVNACGGVLVRWNCMSWRECTAGWTGVHGTIHAWALLWGATATVGRSSWSWLACPSPSPSSVQEEGAAQTRETCKALVRRVFTVCVCVCKSCAWCRGLHPAFPSSFVLRYRTQQTNRPCPALPWPFSALLDLLPYLHRPCLLNSLPACLPACVWCTAHWHQDCTALLLAAGCRCSAGPHGPRSPSSSLSSRALNTTPSAITAPPRTPAAPSAPPAPSPVPVRWSLTNRVFNLNLRSLYQGPPRPPASRLWNPVNSSPRTPAAAHSPRPPPRDDYPNLPVHDTRAENRDEYPLLTLPQRRQSRQSPASSLAVQRSTGDDTIAGRTSIALPRSLPASQPPTPGPAMSPADARDDAPGAPLHADKDIELGATLPSKPNHSRVSLPDSARPSMGSRSGSARGDDNDDDAVSEFAWGPSHPCFPHPNPHVPLTSDLYNTTRIIRIKRDWMIKGDLAPTFANLYPEILDPLISEDDFRLLIKKINDALIDAFDPFTFRAWVDAVMGVATFWLWDDVGLTGVKRKLADLESWIEGWNRDVGAKEAVKIISLRRTGYLTLDVQIPDPRLGPDTGSRPPTQEDDHSNSSPNQQTQFLPYTLTPTLQVNSQPTPMDART
ncbi:hypothetical protein NX059_001963 [Plenodomus lindquistii]|nr:hypothetical protein NX059_001963 [Plenodomus lindquistii]